MKKQWCREFQAYAKAHGRSCDEQIEHDRKRWPGGVMCGFILWMDGALKAFEKESPQYFVGGCVYDHEAKIRFLNQYKSCE